PAGRNVVNHNITDRITADSVITASDVGFPSTEAHMANQHVVRVYPDRLPSHNHAISRSGLAGNRDVRSPDDQRGLQANNTGDIKYDYTRASLFTGFTKSSWTMIFQTSHYDHFSTSSTESIFTTPLCTWKCGNLCLR